MKKLSIIIPVFNEQSRVYEALSRIKSVELLENISKELLIVNDGSSDNSKIKIEEFIDENRSIEIKYFEHKTNKGKGASIKTALPGCTGDYIIIQDADLEYDPGDINSLLVPMIKNYADVVYGSRFIGEKPHRVLYFWHYIGNKFITSLSNLFTNLNLTDIETCYKLFKADYIKSINLKENRFGFEPEVTAKMAKIPNIRFYEVGISYFGRTYKDGKKVNWKDGIKAIFYIFKYNLF